MDWWIAILHDGCDRWTVRILTSAFTLQKNSNGISSCGTRKIQRRYSTGWRWRVDRPPHPHALLHSVLRFFVSINALEVRVTNLPSRNCEPPRLDWAAATALPALCEEGIQWDWEEVRGILPSTFRFTRNLFPIQKGFSVESSQSSTNSRLLSLFLSL